MTIGEHERELLAELKDMPSFVLLMAIFKHFEEEVLSELSLSKKESDLVRISRFYQCLREIRSFLESRPQEAQNELTRIKETYFPKDVLDMGIDELMRTRFDRDQ